MIKYCQYIYVSYFSPSLFLSLISFAYESDTITFPFYDKLFYLCWRFRVFADLKNIHECEILWHYNVKLAKCRNTGWIKVLLICILLILNNITIKHLLIYKLISIFLSF